jgi:hypothetical protein
MSVLNVAFLSAACGSICEIVAYSLQGSSPGSPKKVEE